MLRWNETPAGRSKSSPIPFMGLRGGLCGGRRVFRRWHAITNNWYTYDMATPALISWNAPEHIHVEKTSDWYWAVGIITLALAAVVFIFGNVVTGILVLVAAVALVLHASRPPRILYHEVNDRGIIVHETLYPFLSLHSFWIPHDEFPAKIIIKSRKLFMPYIVLYIDEIDPEHVREVMLRYIAETEHHEPFLKHVLERLGF